MIVRFTLAFMMDKNYFSYDINKLAVIVFSQV